MVTDAQNLLNLGSAANLAAYELGLDGIRGDEWTHQERLEFIQRLAAKILQYPDRFSAQSLASAGLISGRNDTGRSLDDYINAAPDGRASLAADFVNTLGDNLLAAGADIASVGTGSLALLRSLGNSVSNVGRGAEQLTESAASGWLIPVAVVAVVALLVLSASKEVRRAIP